MRYLPVQVLCAMLRGIDCSNGGITARQPDKLCVPCPDGQLTEEDVADNGYVVLEPQVIGGCPSFKQRGMGRWTMFGGNYVTGDSRFSDLYSNQPIAVHDRIEN